MKNSAQPAYPTRPGQTPNVNGLTKREAFAMAAMQGILSGRNEVIEERGYPPTEVAQWAVQQADELLKALEQE